MTIQAIADQFGVCEYTVFSIVKRLANIVCQEFLQKYIKWPVGENVFNIVKGFKDLKNFPGVIGAIDGSHIPIKTPTHCPENYINRKSFPSVILQAVCDSRMSPVVGRVQSMIPAFSKTRSSTGESKMTQRGYFPTVHTFWGTRLMVLKNG